MPSGPIGEAWLLSDRDDHASQVAEGPLKGQTIGQLLKQFPEQMLGKARPPLSAISAAVEVPRCEGTALRTSASNESEYESVARG